MNKKEARKYYKNIRANISFNEKKRQSEGIASKLEELILKNGYTDVLFYAPLPDEVDVMRAYDEMTGKVKTYFPRVNGDSMEFFEVKSKEELEIGTFNVYEPKISCKSIDYNDKDKYLCIVPGIAFDKNGGRIGYGKGYYDKYLSGHEEFAVDTVGVCFDECLAEKIETDSFDKSVKMILTFSK